MARNVDANDDWVSVILADVGLDIDPEPSSSLVDLADLPIPDPEDLVFTEMDVDASKSSRTYFFDHGCSPHGASDVRENIQVHCCSQSSTSSSLMCCDFRETSAKCPSPGHGSILICKQEYSSMASKVEAERGKVDCNDGSLESGLSNRSSTPPGASNGIHAVESEPEVVKTSLLGLQSGSYERYSSFAGNLEFGFYSSKTEKKHPGPNVATQGDVKYNVFGDMFQGTSSSVCKSNGKNKRLHSKSSRCSSPQVVATDGICKVVDNVDTKDEDEDKRQARLMRNRESAQLSRQRKKVYEDELEEKIKTMAFTIAELNNTINLISAENINFRQQLGVFGPPPPAAVPGVVSWPSAYPPASGMGTRYLYPVLQVPLVPIPKWKSQHINTVKKTRKNVSELQKGGSKKIKKIAGVCFLTLFFILLPFDIKFLGSRFSANISDSHQYMGNSRHIRAGGRVLTGINEGWDTGPEDLGNRKSQMQVHMNGSVPLAATLFVPRDEGLVRVAGNLTIHYALSGETNKDTKTFVPYYKERVLDANLKALAVKATPEEKGSLLELQRVLAKKSKVYLEGGGIQSLLKDGSLQHWFLEDLTGPIFMSGMCTEIFQFENSVATSSPSSTPASCSHNGKSNIVQNVTTCSRKRAHYSVPLPPVDEKLNFKQRSTNSTGTESQAGFKTNRGFTAKPKTVVVSVLSGSEYGDQKRGKSPSTIFVVILVDNVKYTTYSCMLPSSEEQEPQYEVVVE